MKALLPDGRLTRPRRSVRHRGQNWIPLYCANCGVSGGLVPEDATFAFWLCNSCYEKHGTIANTLAVPDEEFWSEQRGIK